MIAEMPHANAGMVKGIKSAIHLSETVVDAYVAPPKLGEHTREVLIKLLGYTGDEVDMLARGGASDPVTPRCARGCQSRSQPAPKSPMRSRRSCAPVLKGEGRVQS
jgi:hypothetical protein